MNPAWVAISAALFCGQAQGREVDLWAHGVDPLHEKYEALFDSQYPGRAYDPFNRLRPFDDVREFNRRFEERVAGIWTRVDKTDDHIDLWLRWPEAGQALDVSVDEAQVRLRPSAPAPERVGPWRWRSAGLAQRQIALPREADHATATVTRQGELIRVRFSRR